MTDPIRVLTFNTFKLGGPVDPERVVDRILELEPDVVGFQEVFNTNPPIVRPRNAKKILERRLEGEGEGDYVTSWFPGGGPGPFRPFTFGRFSDGILVAARRDRWDVDGGREPFGEVVGRGGLFDRRVIQCLLLREKNGSARTIAFFNTHLVVGTSDKKRQRREEEVRKALEFIGRVEAEHAPVASILVGDFNAVADELARSLPSAPGERFADTWVEVNGDAGGITIDRDNSIVQARRNDKQESMRIDYVFLRPHPADPGAAFRPRSCKVVLNKCEADTKAHLSDHYGVLTELEVV